MCENVTSQISRTVLLSCYSTVLTFYHFLYQQQNTDHNPHAKQHQHTSHGHQIDGSELEAFGWYDVI